ncbi:MAG: SDR family oxidoreductase [Flavobacteriales bacterium]|nr:SDR family oxidoreductase [Flavobacteriales bacterium]
MRTNEAVAPERLLVVTGASSGVGRATAKSLVLEHGCSVIAVARSAGALEELSNECKAGAGQLHPLVLDLEQADAVAKVQQTVSGRRLHGLVNNAGLLIKQPFGAWTAPETSRLFHLNAAVPLLLAQGLAPLLAGAPPGHVVNISSMGGFQGSVKFPGLAAYSASKAALTNLTECLAEEMKDLRVRCNCICLGAVDTPMLRAAFPGYPAPVGPEEVGGFLARFVLEGHKFFNGKVLPFAVSTP